MQDSLGDGNALTSDAIFVSSNSSVPMPSRGDIVSVRGIVQNYSAFKNEIASTRLACVDSIAILGSGHRIPAAQPITTIGSGPGDIGGLVSGYNAYKGMLVKFNTTAIVSPTSQPAFVPSGNLSSSGVYVSNRVAINESPSVNVVDYNPEVLLIGSKTASVPQVRAQDTLFSMTGIVDYDKGWICIQPLADSMSLSHSSKPTSPISVRSNTSGSLKISTFDFGGFFDTIDTWGKNDPVSSASVYTTKITKMRKAIAEELAMPAILCVQNVENSNVLKDIVVSVNSQAGGKYKAATGRVYMGFSVDTPSTPDPRGVINGFLYDTTQCKLDSIKILGGASIDSAFGIYSPMPATQPIVGFFKINGAAVSVVNVSLIDKNSDNACFTALWPYAEQSKQVRKMQALAVRSWINAKLAAAPSSLMIIAGEFNDYPFAETLDGASYPVSIVAGNASKGEVVFYNAYDYLPVDSRYTCIINGRAQMTEQLMVNPALGSYAKGVNILHFNANFEDSFASDPTTAARSSSHDAVEIRF
jgi:predicted extracellular nuclease